MCTVVVLFQAHPDAPVIIGHNRDEMRDRPTAGYSLWTPEGARRPILAGRDEVSGGTWFAVGEHLVACVTNHHAGEDSPPGERSRGELVTAAAVQEDLADVEDLVQTWASGKFGPYHLLVSDGEDMLYVSNAGRIEHEPPAFRRVGPGLHVLRNAALDDDEDPVVGNLHAALGGLAKRSVDEVIVEIQEVLRRDGEGWPYVGHEGYGTRSSGVLVWGGDDQRLVVADGPGEDVEWVDLSAQIPDLRTLDIDPDDLPGAESESE